MFFGMPETKFIGERPSTLPASSDQNLEKTGTEHNEKFDGPDGASVVNTQETVGKQSYVSSLRLWTRGDPHVSLKKAFLRPFVLVAYPTVLWSSIIYGLALGWNVILGASVAQLFAPP